MNLSPKRRPINPHEFVRVLQRVGLLPDSDMIQAVYISVEQDRPVDIQIRMFADDRLYDIAPELAKDAK